MPQIMLKLAGRDYRHRLGQLSSGSLLNMYVEANPDPNKPPVALSWPGLTLFSSGVGYDRGVHVMANVTYHVNGSSLQSIDSDGVRTTLGSVSGSGMCSFADDGTNLFFVTNNTIYYWDGTTLSTVAQTGIANPIGIAYLNRTFIIWGDDGLFATSSVGDGTEYNALNFAEAEVAPDGLLVVKIYNQIAYMIGEKTTEVWYYSGSGNPPLSRQDTTLVNTGCAAQFSVASSDQYIYWLGDDGLVYQIRGTADRSISDPTLHQQVADMTLISDAVGVVITYDAHVFYVLSFPDAGKTYFYDESLGYWGTISSGMDGARHRINTSCFCYRKILVADHSTGDLYELDRNSYTHNGDAILRRRTCVTEDADGRDIVVRRLKLIAESGVGLATGQGSDPQVMLEASFDRGKTWSQEEWRSIGEMGQYDKEIEWAALGRGQSFTARFSFTDPAGFDIYKAVAWVEYGR